MKFDLHLHTNRHSPDSDMDPFAMLRRARQIGLDGVVITEHDWLWTEPELEELRAAEPGLVVLAGIEVTARQGHFLVYGVHDPFAVPRGINVADLCREVHRQGGVVVAAHPYRWGQPFDDILRTERPELDGLEMMSNNMDEECRRRAAGVMAAYGPLLRLAGLGNSDAHCEAHLGLCYTVFADPVYDTRGLVDAIRHRRTIPKDRRTDEMRTPSPAVRLAK
jgi:predicted metal-dependent phosphoesterase TrpH